MLVSSDTAAILITAFWVWAAPSQHVQLVTHKPGHVLQDRRDELNGGMRLKLQGVRPRPRVEPRSRLRIQPDQSGRARIDPRVEPLAPRLGRLPVARRTTLDSLLAACRARYRSFDETTRTYRTLAGEVRRCPYLP